jgi:biopolymer transport protein TolR
MAIKFKPTAVMSSPNVIPMADVMLVLLIIFMVVVPMIVKGRPVDMARAANTDNMPNAERDDAVIVAVTRDGQYFLSPGNSRVALDKISGDVKNLVADKLDKTVYVRSDFRAKYGDVVKAVDQIRSAGVDNIGLLTEKIAPNSTPRHNRGS